VTTRRPPTYGPEPWADRAGATWSHWDLWFCLVCLTESGGDWDSLEEAIITHDRRRSVTSQMSERKRSHILDLRDRLEATGLTAARLAAEHLEDKPLRAKARRKVLDQHLTDRHLTPAMRDTPRRRLQARALRGHWPSFPVSPEEYDAVFADVVDAEHRSFRLAAELKATAAEELETRGGDPAHRLALWRAVLTAGLEALLHGLRDSDGAVGMFVGDALEIYTSLPWRETGIEPATYWTDLCEWCIWEDYGLRHRRNTAPFLGARRCEVDMVERLLLDLAAEHRSHGLDYEADEAIQLIAWLVVATGSLDRFVPAAQRLRADWWIPVDAMGEAAANAGEFDLAAEVYGAAIASGGWHVDHLTRLCHQRAGLPPTPQRPSV